MLTVFGGLLIVVGVVIQAFDWRQSSKATDDLGAIRAYVDQLDLDRNETAKMAATPVGGQIHGMDLQQVTEILHAGTEAAWAATKRQALDKAAEVEALQARRRPYVYGSWVLIAAGTLVQAYAAWIAPT